MRRAVIDIGTNTVKLFVADVQHGQVVPVFATDKTTRLGEGLGASRQLSPAAIARTVQTVADFLAEAKQQGATQTVALTTAAAREAGNRDEFLAGVRDKCGLIVEVITGDREAELIFRGVSSDPTWSAAPLIVLDVGGGSGELIQGQNGRLEKWVSLPIGAVRLTEALGDNFTTVSEHLRRELPVKLAGFDATRRQMIATGGGITTLAKVERASRPFFSSTVNGRDARSTNIPDHHCFTLAELRSWGERLSTMPLAERKKVPGLPPERADIIVAGGAVFVVAMEILGATELTVSVRSLRYGALL